MGTCKVVGQRLQRQSRRPHLCSVSSQVLALIVLDYGHSYTFFSLLELDPSARSLFGFKDLEDLHQNPKYAVHANSIVDMIDTGTCFSSFSNAFDSISSHPPSPLAVSFLGPDLDPLEEDLHQLGRRHFHYGVEAKSLPLMEKSLIYMLEELLGDRFTRNDRNSWQVIFYFIMLEMSKGMSQKS
jgi:hypothetical protein